MVPQHHGARGRADAGATSYFLLVALAIGLGTAALTHAVGLSLALGAFLGGLADQRVGLRARGVRAPAAAARRLRHHVLRHGRQRSSIRRGVFEHLPLLGVIVALVIVGKAVTRTLAREGCLATRCPWLS